MQAGVAAGSSTYRLWIYTSAQDTGGAKGHLTLKLAGTLGEVTFAHLERSAARQGTLFAPGKCCEIFKQDVDVGSMLKLTVQYGSEAALGGIHVHRSPWNLVQIIVGTLLARARPAQCASSPRAARCMATSSSC